MLGSRVLGSRYNTSTRVRLISCTSSWFLNQDYLLLVMDFLFIQRFDSGSFACVPVPFFFLFFFFLSKIWLCLNVSYVLLLQTEHRRMHRRNVWAPEQELVCKC